MSERIPSLDVYHPVTNVGKDQIAALSRELTGDECMNDEREKTVRKILRPAKLLRTEALVHTELLRLYEYAGINGVTEEHIDELSEYLGGVLPEFSHEGGFDAPMVPAEVKPLGAGLVLSVACSEEVIQERSLIKAALANFYRLDTIPPEVWLDDERVAGAWLARSQGPNSNALLRQLEVTLEHNPGLLPDRAAIGGVAIRPNPHRNSAAD